MNFDDSSRDELIKYCKSMQETLLRQGNEPPHALCPFCYGNKMVSSLKCQVKSEVISEWRKDVTQDEYEAWWEKYSAQWTKK